MKIRYIGIERIIRNADESDIRSAKGIMLSEVKPRSEEEVDKKSAKVSVKKTWKKSSRL